MKDLLSLKKDSVPTTLITFPFNYGSAFKVSHASVAYSLKSIMMLLDDPLPISIQVAYSPVATANWPVKSLIPLLEH